MENKKFCHLKVKNADCNYWIARNDMLQAYRNEKFADFITEKFYLLYDNFALYDYAL